MARFPTRENDVAVLAEGLIAGLSERSSRRRRLRPRS